MVTGEGGGRNGRMIKVAGVLGATMLLLAVVCLREGADNGVRSVLEGGWSSFRKKAPEIQLAERSSSVSGSSSSLYGGGSGALKKSLQLLSVEPLFSADSTRKLVSVLEAKSNWANKGGFITLHSIPTQITLSAPEDVTIRLGSVDGKTGKSPFSMTTSLADDERSDSKGGDEDGDKMAVFMKYFNKTQAKLFKEWGYEKNKPGVLSPKLWGFRHEWKVCRSGKAQSPVNMEREGMRGVGLDPLGWMCGSSPCESFNSTESASKQSFDGHALVVEAFDGDGTPKLTANSETYSLEQLTLHTPSEHTLDGAHFDLEVQMMHRSETGKGLAVSVLMEAGEGNESPSWIEALSAVVKPCLLSTDSADCLLGSTPSHLAKSFSFRDFATSLGGLQHYYNYNGSHTAPPCNEDVQWNILRKPYKVNQADWTIFAALQGKNNRPVQALNGRSVLWI